MFLFKTIKSDNFPIRQMAKEWKEETFTPLPSDKSQIKEEIEPWKLWPGSSSHKAGIENQGRLFLALDL